MTDRHAWHSKTTEQICNELETNVASGLSGNQAAARAKKLYIRQPDAMQPLFIPPKHYWYRDLLRMILDPIVLLTLITAMIAFGFNERILGGTIVSLLVCNAVRCAIANAQERRVWSRLQAYSNPMVKIVRSGKLFTTDARNVLPGDILILSEGDICPADARLCEGFQIEVSQYVLTAKDQRKFELKSAYKNGDILYQPDRDDVFNPNCENIVYAGSVVKKGFARAVVVETGRHTYIGASNGTVPGTEHSTEPQSVSHIRRYITKFSTVQAILLIPLTILLVVTLHRSLSFVESFVTALALCCTTITIHIVSFANTIRAAGINAAASYERDAGVAIIKNADASDKLCEMTDLFLFDSAAISDGKYHLESVYARGSIYNLQELLNPDVRELATQLYLYRTATCAPEMRNRDQFDAGLIGPIDALIRHMGLDLTAINMTRIGSRISYEDGCCIVHSQMKHGEHEILLSDDLTVFQTCTHVAAGETLKELDQKELDALHTLCRIYCESGYRIVLVANRTGGCTCLLGILAFAQRVGRGFAQCCEQLINDGVRVSAFMENNPENLKLLADCGLIRDFDHDVLTAQSAIDSGLDLHVAYGSYRAYLGFGHLQISDLMQYLKQRGNRIASYTVDHKAQDLHNTADLRITCDAIEYRSEKVAQSFYDKMPVDGKPFSSRATQQMRCSSDVILRRAGAQGGGLQGLLTGRKYALAINYNLANAMTYLVTMQFFRAILLIIPAIFGTYMLSSVALLISGLVLDLAAVLLFAFAEPKQTAFSFAYPILRRLEKPIAYNAANIISASVSALVLWLAFALLQIFGVVDSDQSSGLGFMATYLLQGLVFCVTFHEYSARSKIKNMLLIAVSIAYALLLGASIFLATPGALTGAQTLSWATVLLSPAAALIYLILYRVLSIRGLNLHK